MVLQDLIWSSPARPRCSQCLLSSRLHYICTSFHWPSGPMCMVGSIACNARCYQTKFCSCRRGWGRSNKDHDSLCRYAWRAYWKVGEIYSCTVAYNTEVNSQLWSMISKTWKPEARRIFEHLFRYTRRTFYKYRIKELVSGTFAVGTVPIE